MNGKKTRVNFRSRFSYLDIIKYFINWFTIFHPLIPVVYYDANFFNTKAKHFKKKYNTLNYSII